MYFFVFVEINSKYPPFEKKGPNYLRKMDGYPLFCFHIPTGNPEIHFAEKSNPGGKSFMMMSCDMIYLKLPIFCHFYSSYSLSKN